MEVVNKVIIREEALWDYEDISEYAFPKKEIKSDIENYIDIMQENRRLLSNYYFHAKWYDEQLDEELIVFLYKGEKIRTMQYWELKGICKAEDYDEEFEESGRCRAWLNTIVDETDNTDWVWDLRVRQERERRMNEYMEQNESHIVEINELLKNYKVNKGKIALNETSDDFQELKANMEFLDKCIEQLDDEAMGIIKGLYVKKKSMSCLAKAFGYCKAAIFKKKKRAIEMLDILYSTKK